MIVYFFFLQAEDGIRYLVRSRGLGDVYKRQGLATRLPREVIAIDGKQLRRSHDAPDTPSGHAAIHMLSAWATEKRRSGAIGLEAVSYTHLTLPTSDLV